MSSTFLMDRGNEAYKFKDIEWGVRLRKLTLWVVVYGQNSASSRRFTLHLLGTMVSDVLFTWNAKFKFWNRIEKFKLGTSFKLFLWCLILHLSCRRKLSNRILNLDLEINKKDSILKLALVMNDIICNKVYPYFDEKKLKHWQNELFYLVPLSI